ncbi:ribosomal protein S6 [Bradyrhizobium sp. LM4.3]
MALYEHVFLARQDASTQQVEELTAQMTGIVEGLGGKVVKTENWGVRSLTYRMNKNRKAHFVLLNTSTRRPRRSPRSSARSASAKT